jgi:outer membrane protein TolC
MPIGRASVLVGVVLGCGLAAAAWGQPAGGTAPDDSLLAALVREALARNPVLLAAEEAARAAGARPQQAQALPYPMLSVQYTNDGVSPSLGERDMTTLAFMLSQDLPYPGKRGLRGAILRRDAERAGLQLERLQLGVAAGVRRAYTGLRLARGVLDVVREQAEIWKQIEAISRSRYAVGQTGQQDILRVQVEMSRIAEIQAEQEVEALVRLAELNQLLARPADAPLDTRAPLRVRALEGDHAAWFARLRAASPEVRSAALAVEGERLGVRLAKKETRPDLTLQAGYMNRGGLDPMWLAGLGLSLPISRSRPAGAVSEAEARLRSGERSVEAVELVLRLRTQERVAQLQSTERIARLYDDGIVPQDRLAVDAAIASYEVGSVPFITVLEALSTLYSDRTTALRLRARHEVLRANLEEASLEADAAAPMSTTAGLGGGPGGSEAAGGGMR